MNKQCLLCPNCCRVDKTKEKGLCGTDNEIRIAKFYLHKWEEPCISGTKGSGTVFFSGCSLGCVFCQNYEVSHLLRGKVFSVQELSDIFKQLEDMGAHNVNLVTPTHYSDKIIEALNIYRPKIPIVYNTHGYERVETLKELDKYIDVYLPDLKFFSPAISKRYCNKENYFEVASKAIDFMTNKPVIFDGNGMITSGTIIRHLVLPMNISESKKILDYIANNGLHKKTYLSIMRQYTPFGDIEKYPELKRKITDREYDTVIDYAMSLGIENMFYQDEKSSSEEYIPKWDY